MIQNWLPRVDLNKGEFIFCRFDAVGDSATYPIVQMPFITQSNWQNRVITSIICVASNTAVTATYTDILKRTTPLFRNYGIIDFADLVGYTITLKTNKNIIVLDNMPLTLLGNLKPAHDPALVHERKTNFSVSLDNSFITRHADATPLTTSVVIPFYVEYK